MGSSVQFKAGVKGEMTDYDTAIKNLEKELEELKGLLTKSTLDGEYIQMGCFLLYVNLTGLTRSGIHLVLVHMEYLRL